ncbi:potassium-transporting ATPase subunit KdpA [Mediterraneibacter glycyrrhizinilyticus]|uniref:potassium-transporting ATPase subunit KdpA n=1 Tax=Mediterraneibacter glycyrrhizinilyticus TaxID=342942 RepID=UPI0030421E31|nr:potassium-transporting ATPase subunit KdpA [Lachnospiraceae bacterium]
MLQIILTLAIFLILVIPMGKYMYHIATEQKTFADKVFDSVDRLIYKVCGIKGENMGWKTYALTLLTANAVMVFVGYLILRLQNFLFLNPNGIDGMEASLSFNTVISFMTNTNLQHYSGESGLAYVSQMCVIIFMMFTSAASGYAACMAFCRGLSGRKLGNFYRDMVRITTRILIPVSFIVALILVSQGTPQTLIGNLTVETVEGKLQDLAMGPVAALEAIKHLGTNGGGFFGANSATPFENPTVISNIVEMISMMILPGACVVTFGHMLAEKRRELKEARIEKKKIWMGRQGAVIFGAMAILFAVGLLICYNAEMTGNPIIREMGIDQSAGSMEGKEVRFGVAQSSLFTTVTTSFTTGTVNNMHDTLTPLGGMVPMLHMMLNCVFGGKGVGLMNMVMYVILAVFICGLMVGRTPEYLNKKIEGKEMKLVAIVILIHPLLILGFSGLAVSLQAGLDGITNPSFHGLSQVLYEYASSAANNGSGFEGLADNSVFWNVTTGLAMFFGRYIAIVAQLAIAGSLLAKKKVNETIGTLRTDNVTFMIILVFIVYIFAALTFFPALALGPIGEHLSLWM